jgi:iron complex transport system permease protein
MKTIVLGAIAIIILFFANLAWGSVNIPWQDVGAIISGSQTDETYRYILLESRLPAAITALLSGAALATSGLLLQTAFRNPLAGPDVFGISSGAGLAVAIVMLAFGGNIALDALGVGFLGDASNYAIGGFLAVLIAAFIGAMVVMGIITFFSAIVRSHTVLLIIGLMVGYLASSAISLLNFFSTAEGVKSYMVWGMGSFGNVSSQQMMFFIPLALIVLAASLLLVKPLNAMLLGEQYAENLGFNIRRLRIVLLIITGLLTAVVTAFCGPIAMFHDGEQLGVLHLQGIAGLHISSSRLSSLACRHQQGHRCPTQKNILFLHNLTKYVCKDTKKSPFSVCFLEYSLYFCPQI